MAADSSIGSAKFDPVKMIELVKVEESEDGSEIALVFADGKRINIRADGDTLVSSVVS